MRSFIYNKFVKFDMEDFMESSSRTKSKAFAIRIINLYKYLCYEKKEYVLSKQVLRSGTSIGANLAEAQFAASKSDFLSKQVIALKECGETSYWLELLYEADYLDYASYVSINEPCQELIRMLTASTKTLKEEIEKARKMNNKI